MMRVLIIAEAGVNHNGDISIARKLVQAAADSGADFIKFQSFKASKLVSKKARKADYQLNNLGGAPEQSQYEMLQELELSEENHIALLGECKKAGIQFLSTAFDTQGLDYLVSLGIDVIKIPSGEITNYPYLKRVGELGRTTILSTGMADVREIKLAIDVLIKNGLRMSDLTVLHCNTEYPTPMTDVNLKAINYIADKFGVQIGYSDHTLGIEIPVAAVALGARVIEKHFTLDRNLLGPDHAASLEPEELKAMIKSIRNIELALSGDGIKRPSDSEKKNIVIARKSIHTNRDLQQGHVLTNEDLIPLRPGDGISPMKWTDLIGKTLTKNLYQGDKLSEEDFQ